MELSHERRLLGRLARCWLAPSRGRLAAIYDAAFGERQRRELADDYGGYLASQVRAIGIAECRRLPTSTILAAMPSRGRTLQRASIPALPRFGTQGLLAVQGDTLVLTFRGTDSETRRC
jgi:hypothetical protein